MLLGNLLWWLAGFRLSSAVLSVAGGLLLLSVVGFPAGWRLLDVAAFTFAPFGSREDPAARSAGCLSGAGNLFWFVCVGWWLALWHLLWAAILAPWPGGRALARRHGAAASLVAWPFGRVIIPDLE